MIIRASLFDSLECFNFMLSEVFAVTLIQDTAQGQSIFLLCQWSKQLVIDCHWSNTLEQYYIHIWYIFDDRISFGDVFKFYKFLFWLSVYFVVMHSLCKFIKDSTKAKEKKKQNPLYVNNHVKCIKMQLLFYIDSNNSR